MAGKERSNERQMPTVRVHTVKWMSVRMCEYHYDERGDSPSPSTASKKCCETHNVYYICTSS